MVQIGSTQTITSAVAAVDFTSGITSTYKALNFRIYNLTPSATAHTSMQVSVDGGSNWGNVNGTWGMGRSYLGNSGNAYGWGYDGTTGGGNTTPMHFDENQYTDLDKAGNVDLWLYHPTSTVVWKGVWWRKSHRNSNNYDFDYTGNGYWKTTSAINAVRFKFSTGNVAQGVFKMFGIK